MEWGIEGVGFADFANFARDKPAALNLCRAVVAGFARKRFLS